MTTLEANVLDGKKKLVKEIKKYFRDLETDANKMGLASTDFFDELTDGGYANLLLSKALAELEQN